MRVVTPEIGNPSPCHPSLLPKVVRIAGAFVVRPGARTMGDHCLAWLSNRACSGPITCTSMVSVRSDSPGQAAQRLGVPLYSPRAGVSASAELGGRSGFKGVRVLPTLVLSASLFAVACGGAGPSRAPEAGESRTGQTASKEVKSGIDWSARIEGHRRELARLDREASTWNARLRILTRPIPEGSPPEQLEKQTEPLRTALRQVHRVETERTERWLQLALAALHLPPHNPQRKQVMVTAYPACSRNYARTAGSRFPDARRDGDLRKLLEEKYPDVGERVNDELTARARLHQLGVKNPIDPPENDPSLRPMLALICTTAAAETSAQDSETARRLSQLIKKVQPESFVATSWPMVSAALDSNNDADVHESRRSFWSRVLNEGQDDPSFAHTRAFDACLAALSKFVRTPDQRAEIQHPLDERGRGNAITDGVRAMLDGAAGRAAFEKKHLELDADLDPWVKVTELLVYR